jgi:hypothetical protein
MWEFPYRNEIKCLAPSASICCGFARLRYGLPQWRLHVEQIGEKGKGSYPRIRSYPSIRNRRNAFVG